MAASAAINQIEAPDAAEPAAALARRLSVVRKQKGLAQTELGRRAQLRYTRIGRFGRGASRPGGDTVTNPSDALDLTGDYVPDWADDDDARAKVADRELLQQFEAVERLPDEDKQFVKTLLAAFLTKRQLQTLGR